MLLYAFQQVKGETREGLEGWRFIFAVLWVVTVVIAMVVGVWLDAGAVLGEGKKVVLLRHVAVNRIGIKNTGFKARQVLEVVLDGQLWFTTLPTILVCVIGFRRYLIADLPCGLDLNLKRRDDNILRNPHQNISITSTLTVGYDIRYTSHRWAWLVVYCIPGIFGGALLSFATHNRAAQLAGIYFVNAITRPLIVIYQWTASNVARQRVVAMSLVSGNFSAGNGIGLQTFQARDAPWYTPAKITNVGDPGCRGRGRSSGVLILCVG